MKAEIIEEEMNKYFVQLTDIEKKSVLNMIKAFLQGRSGDSEEDIDEYNKEIDEALAEVRRGEYYTHEEVVKMAKNW